MNKEYLILKKWCEDKIHIDFFIDDETESLENTKNMNVRF